MIAVTGAGIGRSSGVAGKSAGTRSHIASSHDSPAPPLIESNAAGAEFSQGETHGPSAAERGRSALNPFFSGEKLDDLSSILAITASFSHDKN